MALERPAMCSALRLVVMLESDGISRLNDGGTSKGN